MPLAERIATVAEDVQTRRDEFRDVEPHELAEILDVPEPRQPVDWVYTCYAEIQSAEEYADGYGPVSDLVYLIKDKVSPERFKVLVEKFAKLPDYARSESDFLVNQERKLLEEAIALTVLQSNMENGISSVGPLQHSSTELDSALRGRHGRRRPLYSLEDTLRRQEWEIYGLAPAC